MSKTNVFIGLDPGKSGAMSVIDEYGSILKLLVVPTIGKEYDKHKMWDSIAEWKNSEIYHLKHCVLEDVHATHMGGNTACFEFGRGKALWEMILCGMKLPHTMIQPKAWQKELWEGVKRVYKPGKKKETVDTKATSLIAAKRLFPNETFLATPRSSVPHDGLYDSTLLAEYCRRKFK